jgi:hypothetical protein
MVLGRLDIYGATHFPLCKLFLSLSKEVSRGLGTVHSRRSSSLFGWLCLLSWVWCRNLNGVVHALRGIFPNVLAREMMPGLVARCCLLGVLLAIFREERLILFDVIQGCGSKLLRVVVLVNTSRSALGSVGPALRAARRLLQIATVSAVMVDSR